MSYYSASMYKSDIERIGFYQRPFMIGEPIGNNVFSFDRRKQKKIHVPNMIEGQIASIECSDRIAFVEVDEQNIERMNFGLKNFVRQGDHFIFDNHNHCYYFYKLFLRMKQKTSMGFVHIDQHKDLREPKLQLSDLRIGSNMEQGLKELGIEKDLIEDLRELWGEERFLEEAQNFLYTNRELNVGNFIKPLLAENRISELAIIDSHYTMQNFSKETFAKEYVLDLDLDFFSKDMDYIDRSERIDFVRDIANSAQAVFIATSPYFIPFDDAKRALREIFG